jgi:CheY-like chemotaxis protein
MTKVLIFESDLKFSAMLRAELQQRGFTVILAANGEEAFERLGHTAVDAIVCDLRMPELDGIGLYERLRQERPGLATRMVFITGDLLSADARLNTRQPILPKPFAFERLEEALVSVLRGTPLGRRSGAVA